MRKTNQINDPNWQDIYDRDCLVRELYEFLKKLRDEMEATGGWNGDDKIFLEVTKNIAHIENGGPERYQM